MAELTPEKLQKLINLGNLQSFKTKLESKIDETYAKASDVQSIVDNMVDARDFDTAVGNISNLTERVGNVEGALDNYATIESLAEYAKSSDVATTYATKSELSDKADAQHGHAISEINGLQTALDKKAESVHIHAIDNITGLTEALGAKADASALAEYAKSSELANYAEASELATLAETVSSNTTAIHNVQGSLSNKADAQHTHAIEEIDDLREELDGLQDAIDSKANASELDNYVLKTNVATDEDIALLFA